MDTLLNKLRAGDSVGRKTRRNRLAGKGSKSDLPSANRLVPQLTGPGAGEAADIAKDMLAALKMDGFNTSAPPSPNPTASSTTSRRARLRGSLRASASADNSASLPDIPHSPLPTEDPIAEEITDNNNQPIFASEDPELEPGPGSPRSSDGEPDSPTVKFKRELGTTEEEP